MRKQSLVIFLLLFFYTQSSFAVLSVEVPVIFKDAQQSVQNLFINGALAAGTVAAAVYLNPLVAVGVGIAALMLQQPVISFKPKDGGATPSGWRGPNAPPLSASSVPMWTNGTLGYTIFATSAQACTQLVAAASCARAGGATVSGYRNSWYSDQWTFLQQWNCSNGVMAQDICSQSGITCPTGYITQSGNCVLSEGVSSGVVKYPQGTNGTGPIYTVDSNGTFIRDIRDPSSVPDDTNIAGKSSVTNNITNTSNNNPVVQTIKGLSGGGISIQQAEQYTNSNGNTSTKVITVNMDNVGNVTSTSTNTYDNSTISQVSGGTVQPQVDVSGLAKEATQLANSSILRDIKGYLTGLFNNSNDLKTTANDIKTTEQGISVKLDGVQANQATQISIFQQILDAINSFKSGGNNSSIPNSDIGNYQSKDNYDQANTSSLNDAEGLANAKARLSSSYDAFSSKVKEKAYTSSYASYLRSFFPVSQSGGDCPPPFEITISNLSHNLKIPTVYYINIDCRIIVIIGDMIIVMATIVAFKYATFRENN